MSSVCGAVPQVCERMRRTSEEKVTLSVCDYDRTKHFGRLPKCFFVDAYNGSNFFGRSFGIFFQKGYTPDSE